MTNVIELYTESKSIVSIKARLQVLSTEEEGFFNRLSHYFCNKLEDIKNFFKSDLVTYKNKSDPFIKELNDVSRLLNKIQNVKFSLISDIVVPVNETFSINLYDIVNKLEVVAEPISDIYLIALDRTDNIISRLISNPEYAKSNRPDKTDPEVLRLIDLGYTTIDSILNPNLRVDNKQIKDLIPNISSLSEIVDKLNKIDRLDMFKNAVKSDKLVKDINAKTIQLINMIKNNNIRDVNKGVLAELGTNLEDSARLVTLVATILYIISQVASTIANIISVIHDVNEKTK